MSYIQLIQVSCEHNEQPITSQGGLRSTMIERRNCGYPKSREYSRVPTVDIKIKCRDYGYSTTISS